MSGFNSVVIDVYLRDLLHALFICLRVLISLVVVLLWWVCGEWWDVVWCLGLFTLWLRFDLLVGLGSWLLWLRCFCGCT